MAYNNADVAALVRWAQDMLAHLAAGDISTEPDAEDEIRTVLTDLAESSIEKPDRGRLRRLAASATRMLEGAAGSALGDGVVLVAPAIVSAF